MFLKKFGLIARNARFSKFMQLLCTRLEKDVHWQKARGITIGRSEVMVGNDIRFRGSSQRLPRSRPYD